ncbi:MULTISPECIES: glycosyltransferase [Bacillus]|uniref:glycosyltransferase n=1 Tax=Bacillus TaxID=1386 RepID=UPI0001A183DF|nr:glycosyltransferase [Bacillus pseudomycoides]EEM14423.1 Glycosyl transferase group 1 [Bacillus pseudomycoides DSM 12442]MED1595597.1 glycosyltransferase [Bacillus pseudomycoides]MED4711846.1 glycosyltransferase [Bacillus pseudomycoides]OOR52965.1 glycosyl transferase [Bacillus pseudomycoides]PDY14299.1 glycosyltransferase [Bacillus pseudomycoides]
MKKNILFIMNNLNCGGAEKALISLLGVIDYSKYKVDLFLFKHEGIFINKLPKEVTLLPEPIKYKYFDMPIKRSLTELMKIGDFKTTFSRGVLGYLAKTETNGAIIEQKIWKYMSKSIDEINKEYDVAIGFQEKNPIYFCVDKVKAKKKIGWIHTDYNKLGIDYSKEKFYFGKLDHIVTVSEELVNILRDNFPEYRKKIGCIHNIVSSRMIRKMSLEKVDFKEENDRSISLISVGRLAKEKGLDISLEAFNILVKKGYDLKWYLIGEGNVREELERRIREEKLEKRVILLGIKENPYPYIKQADIYIQTSRYEGKSISIDEAKILAKPILITNFETANNHIRNNINGVIAEMNPMSVAKHLELLIKEEKLRIKFIDNLKKEELGTEDEVNHLYNLMNS